MTIAQRITDWWPSKEAELLAIPALDYANVKERSINDAIERLYIKIGSSPIPSLAEIEAMDVIVQRQVAAMAMLELIPMASDNDQAQFQSISESYQGAGSSSVSLQTKSPSFLEELRELMESILAEGWGHIYDVIGPSIKPRLPMVFFAKARVPRERSINKRRYR